MMKKAILAAAMALAVTAQAAEGFSPAQEEEIGKIAAAYIEKHPEVVLDAIKKLEAQEQGRHAKFVEQTGASYRDDPATPAKGGKGPKHYIVDFYDYNCGYCKAMEPVIEEALKDKSLGLRVSYVNLPVITKTSAISATVAQAIYNTQKDKFFEFHDRLMRDEADPNSVDSLKQLAESVGIKWDKVEEEMQSGRPQNKIRDDLARSRQLQITGTPYLIIDGREFRGAVQKLSDLKAMFSR
jgi:protein-disulfide isomerase